MAERKTIVDLKRRDDAFLVLDLNNNGLIDDGKELLATRASRPRRPGGKSNGFLALGLYDQSGTVVMVTA